MTRTHDIVIWPLGEPCPRQPAAILCKTQREALRLLELLDSLVCTACTGRPGRHHVRLTTHQGHRPSYHVELCVFA